MNKNSLVGLMTESLNELNLDTGHAEKLLEFVYLLDKWNKTYNLTAIRDLSQMITLHVIDSAAVYRYLQGNSIIDVGTGGGIPGIIFSILNPDLFVTLLDTSHKKTRFLRFAQRQLNLQNIEVVCSRVENYHPQSSYDVVISRAFSEVGNFLKLAGHLCSDNGRVLAMKGPRVESEQNSEQIGFHLEKDIDIKVPFLDAERRLLVFTKI
ncbi:MAG: 16S rRNA (guanine(527)-N(7))-methyltransferase RsmG [Gammaproteobacteria bacterium]|jgi:16S rRNA (guanine527-N7)-methyltransferase